MNWPLPPVLCPQAFDVVERSFLESIDDALAEKASLQSQLPEVASPACAPGGAGHGLALLGARTPLPCHSQVIDN